jgi:hypothetical protein
MILFIKNITLHFVFRVTAGRFPATESDFPAAESVFPATESKFPAVESNFPATESKLPAVEYTFPAIEYFSSAIENNLPAIEFTSPSAEGNLPVTAGHLSEKKNLPDAGKFQVIPAKRHKDILFFRINKKKRRIM